MNFKEYLVEAATKPKPKKFDKKKLFIFKLTQKLVRSGIINADLINKAVNSLKGSLKIDSEYKSLHEINVTVDNAASFNAFIKAMRADTGLKRADIVKYYKKFPKKSKLSDLDRIYELIEEIEEKIIETTGIPFGKGAHAHNRIIQLSDHLRSFRELNSYKIYDSLNSSHPELVSKAVEKYQRSHKAKTGMTGVESYEYILDFFGSKEWAELYSGSKEKKPNKPDKWVGTNNGYENEGTGEELQLIDDGDGSYEAVYIDKNGDAIGLGTYNDIDDAQEALERKLKSIR